MGAKRAVPGRSLPYDILLQAYQKQNQAKGRMYPGMHTQQAAQAKAQQARQQQQQWQIPGQKPLPAPSKS
jgi:hypothetical protein